MIIKWGPLSQSLLIHFALVVFFILIVSTPMNTVKESYTVPIQYPEENLPEEVKQLKEVKKSEIVLKSVNEVAPVKGQARQVFGLSRTSYTDQSSADGVSVKLGNTVAKTNDDLKLNDNDPTALPSPTEEYLVSEMPQVLSQVKPHYPKEARDQRIEGTVVMDILIDQAGLVRQAQILEGLAIFKDVAKAAMMQFKFRPAKVDGRPVAVKIRYQMRFELET